MKKTALFTLAAGLFISVQAQDKITNKEGSDYEFTVVTDIEATDVESQGRTGTCWSFSALSFIESEIMRLGEENTNCQKCLSCVTPILTKQKNTSVCMGI